MEQLESLQRVNRQQRLAEWSRRVEACRNSGLTVVQWCQENGIAVSTYFSWQRKVFQALKEVQKITFAEVPVMEASPFPGHVVASLEISGVQIQVYEGADTNTLQALLQAAISTAAAPFTVHADTRICGGELTDWPALCSLSFSWTPFRKCCSCSAAEDKTASRDCTGKETDFSCCINGWRTERSSGRETKTRCGS